MAKSIKSNNSTGATEELNYPQIVVNTANFNDQDLDDFIKLSEQIERTTRERRSQRRRSNSLVATMTREELFESTNLDDDQFLKCMEYETPYGTGRDRASLLKSIEHIMQYFEEERDGAERQQLTKGNVASAVALFSSEKQQVAKPNVKELQKKYENPMETAERRSSCNKSSQFKSPKLSRKTKVKQMALFFNNKINSMMKISSPEPHNRETTSSGSESIAAPAFTSTLKLKSPKSKAKFPNFVTKLPCPKPSPLFKRKQLQKSTSISSLTISPITKRKQELQKQPSTTCLVAENVFARLSVKDKALLYNRFIADMAKQNPKFSKHAKVLENNVKREVQRGEVVIEKQSSVKYLRECWEAKLTSAKALSKTLQKIRRSTSKQSINSTIKSKEYEDILKSNNSIALFEDDSSDILHVSTLAVVLKNSPELKKCPEKDKSQRKKKCVSFLQDFSFIKNPSKRTQSMIRSSYCVESLAPPRKIRRTQSDRLSPKLFFQNRKLEKLFYHWLKEKNGVAFDISPLDNKYDVIEIVAKNSRDTVLPPHEVEQILEAVIKNLESNKENKAAATEVKVEVEAEIEDKDEEEGDGLDLINNIIENGECADKSVVEIELPLEVEISSDEQTKEVEDDNLDLKGINKTTSEDSQTESKLTLRKKKLRRPLSLRNENFIMNPKSKFSTDSDSDGKLQNMKIQSCTLPKSKKCTNYVQKQIRKTDLNASMPSKKSTVIELNGSPTQIEMGYTLTAMPSPSPHTESDYCEGELHKTSINEAYRSCPSLLEAPLSGGGSNFLRDESKNTHFTDNSKNNIQKEQRQKVMVESFIDQGFETGSNDVESPLKLRRNSGLHTLETHQNSSTPLKDFSISMQQLFNAEQQEGIQKSNTISPIYKWSPDTSTGPALTYTKGNTTNTADSEGLNENGSSFTRFTDQAESSQFWITSGNFTASIAIHQYEADRLLLLSKIYAEKSLEAKEMNFGIDDQKFCANNTAPSDKIIKKIPKENNYSQYWFSTGDVLIPFKGRQITTKKIHGFFNYIRESMEETGSLRFGIDSYEFSNVYQHTQKYMPPIGVSPLKTSDLDQSDVDSEESESNQTFSASGRHNFDSAFYSYNNDSWIQTEQSDFRNQESLGSKKLTVENAKSQQTDTDMSKNVSAATTRFSAPEILRKLQNQQSELKVLEARIVNCLSTIGSQDIHVNINDSFENMQKLGSIMTAINNIGRGNGFNACTTEQLESYLFFLNRYADLCLTNCTAHIKKILDVLIMGQH